MPTYDYACKACGHTFEELQSFSDPLLTKCPKCKKNKLERLFGGGGAIIFKGTGFYETDYRRAGDAKPEGDAKPDAAKADTKADAKTDTPSVSPPPPPPAAATDSAPSTGKSEGSGSKKKAK